MNAPVTDEKNIELEALRNRTAVLDSTLKTLEAKLKIVGDSVNCGIWEYDIATRTLDQDKKLDGKWSEENLVIPEYRKTCRGWGLIYSDDIPVFEAYCDSMDNGDPEYSYDLRCFTDAERYIWLRFTGCAVYDENGKAVKSVGITLDVDKEIRSKEIAENKRGIDTMTGLISGDALKDELKKAVDGGKCGKCALIIVDLDNFQRVNDEMGHVYGDNVLADFAGSLSDMLSGDDIIGRLGGDKFVYLRKNIFDRAVAVSTAHSIARTAAAKPLKDSSVLSASIGVSVYPDDCDSGDALIRGAELALSKAKSLGKNRVIVYSGNDDYRKADIELLHNKIRASSSDKSNLNITGGIDNKLVEYAVDILSGDADADEMIYSIISETGKYYNLNGAFVIVRDDSSGTGISHRWDHNFSDESIEKLSRVIPLIWKYLDVIFKGKVYNVFNKADLDRLGEGLGELQGFRDSQLFVCPLWENGHVEGITVFAASASLKKWEDDVVNSLLLMTKMITANIFRTRNRKRLDSEVFFTNAILSNQRLQSYVIDPDTYELFYITEYTHTVSDDAVGHKCYEVIGGCGEPCRNCPVRCLKNDSESRSIEYYDDNRDAWYSASASTVTMPDGRRMRLICRNDVSQFVEHIQAKDRLTGIMTMDKFETEAMKYLAVRGEKRYCVMYLGFKKFHNINEEWGYSAGDNVLRLFAANMSNNIHDGELFARITGDDFLLFLECDTVENTANRVLTALRSITNILEEVYHGINAFMLGGAYEIKENDWSIESCIDNANIARKGAKKYAGTKRVNDIVIFDDAMQRKISVENEIEATMYDAVTNHEFQVYIQPKVDISSGKIKGAEALCRWIRPDGTFISPGDFIRVFEENGFITELDFYIYQCLCIELRKFLDNGIKPPVISVNVSRAHLISNNAFVDKFCMVIDRYRIPHKLIELELTETMFFDNLDRLLGIITDLHSRGFQISIDDFGSGYSSLNLIKVLPVDVLKIDGEFFKQNEMNDKDKAVISTIFRLAKELRLKTVAEGIETAEQVEFVTQCGCDMIQGYYYYKPMPIAEFEKLVENQR